MLEFFDYKMIWQLLEPYSISTEDKRMIKFFLNKIAYGYYLDLCIERDKELMDEIKNKCGTEVLEKIAHLFNTKIRDNIKEVDDDNF